MSEVLVVTSKVKKVVKEKGMNTSGETIAVLSKHVASLLDKAVANAQADGRKTVMARDFQGLVSE